MINGSTVLFGIMGDPISHTASPRMHNAAFQLLDLNYVYVPLHVLPTNLEAACRAARTLKLKGFNVTVPHKEAILAYLDEVDPFARAIGAVNTVVSIENRLVGFNTDAPGFLFALKEELGIKIAGKTVAILGAGGTAKALSIALAHAGVGKLGVINRTLANATSVISAVCDKCEASAITLNTPEMRRYLSQCDVIVNTTSVGMVEGESPVDDYGWVKQGQVVCDVIYSPEKTTLLREAEVRDAVVLNGVGMLAAQGMLAFELFTGKPVSYSFMKDQILKGKS